MFRPGEEHIEMYDLNHHSHHQHDPSLQSQLEPSLQCQHGHQLYQDQNIHNQQFSQGIFQYFNLFQEISIKT